MKYEYVALFDVEEAGVNVQFVDSEEWYTCGTDIPNAIVMATDILNIHLLELEENGLAIPAPTPIAEVKPADNQLIRLIHADTDQYRKVVSAIKFNPIKYAREQVGMNIKELAEYLDAPYRTVQEWNSGNSRPPRWMERILFNHILQAK